MKPSYNPSKIRRARKFGFRKRNQTSAGRKVLKNRRRKGRAKLTASVAEEIQVGFSLKSVGINLSTEEWRHKITEAL